jgi:hypothetical protein
MGGAKSVPGEIRTATKFWLESVKARDHFESPVLHKSIILKWMLGKKGWRGLIEFIWLL